MSWRYHYPQAEFPYNDLAAENRRRGRAEPEYELIDTGVFDEDRYWQVTVDYAKAAPGDLLMRVQVRNMGPEPGDTARVADPVVPQYLDLAARVGEADAAPRRQDRGR